ncbi:hypothetical protein GGX14DRAFT_384295 [Mycena pura]|uniref:Uncharacterized protein n=1 Tax=Mycena pura TaxID=153505 RepID=A0AAD6YV33_9AGAR|nr:hypothetical protein GGX14DRAFT_384295 [Mycena pura]
MELPSVWGGIRLCLSPTETLMGDSSPLHRNANGRENTEAKSREFDEIHPALPFAVHRHAALTTDQGVRGEAANGRGIGTAVRRADGGGCHHAVENGRVACISPRAKLVHSTATSKMQLDQRSDARVRPLADKRIVPFKGGHRYYTARHWVHCQWHRESLVFASTAVRLPVRARSSACAAGVGVRASLSVTLEQIQVRNLRAALVRVMQPLAGRRRRHREVRTGVQLPLPLFSRKREVRREEKSSRREACVGCAAATEIRRIRRSRRAVRREPAPRMRPPPGPQE